MKKRKTRLLALAVCLAMVMSLMPVSAMADVETDLALSEVEQPEAEGGGTSQEEQTEEILSTVEEYEEPEENDDSGGNVSLTVEEPEKVPGEETESEEENDDIAFFSEVSGDEDGESQESMSVVTPETEDEASENVLEPEEDGISPFAYELTDDASGKVVLSLGNGNGTRNFGDYSGSRSAGTELRYTMPADEDTLAPYADDNGNVTIHLPSDQSLGSVFTVVEGDGDLDDVTADLGKEAAYDYTLIGWVNIATGEYFDVRDQDATAVINLTNENVFYADWIAANYDYGSSDDAGLRDDVVSTADFVTIHMYDFNDIFNMYSASVTQNGTDSETWSDSGTLHSTLLGKGEGDTTLSNSFLLVNDGTGHSQGTGLLQVAADRTAGNTWTNTGRAPRDAFSCWGVTSPDDNPFSALFDPESTLHGVNYIGEGDYLLWLDDDGYYKYDSKTAAAVYNQTDGRFYVYDDVQDVNGTDFSCFLPFNEYSENGNETYSALYGSVNYWFGMDMSVSFYLSNAAGTGGNQVNGEDMVFNFSGDDDILIFIDDVLMLDMSGIHDESFGSINFSTGVITMGMALDDDGNIVGTSNAPLSTESFSLPAGNHKLQVYYLERGGYASNLEIEFNITPLWEYQTGDVQTITAEKVWQDNDGVLTYEETKSLPAVEVGLFDVVSEQTDDSFGYTADGNTYTLAYTDDKEVSHRYVYTVSDGGDTLIYTEKEEDNDAVTHTYFDTNSDGKVEDDAGLVIAWFEDGTLHIRIDEQTLQYENEWSYAWELMDADASYEVLELSESSSYTTSSVSEDLTTYQYWTVIGESEIDTALKNHEDLAVILTEAAQEAEDTVGSTKEAKGWVIVGTSDRVITDQVRFSQIATLETISYDNGSKSYLGTYGVTSMSEINRLGSGAVWYAEDAGEERTDVGESEEVLEEFYLSCLLNGEQYYLSLNDAGDSLTVTQDENARAEFYYDALGELMVDLGEDDHVRVEILQDGTISIGVAEEEAALDDIRIYTLTDTETSGFAFNAVNTLIYEIKLDKVVTNGEPLNGATFSLYQDEDCTEQIGFTVTTDDEKGTVYTVSDDPAADGYTETITAGSVTIAGLAGGTYYLKEDSSPNNEYVHLNEVIAITVKADENGQTSVTAEGAPGHVTAEGDTVTVENHARGSTIVPVQKVWDDADNQDGIRPESITFYLYADDVKVDEATVTAEDGWSWIFTNLPIYQGEDDGEDHDVKIEYTVTEVSVDGYETKIDSYETTVEGVYAFTVTNSHTLLTTSVTVNKSWDDGEAIVQAPASVYMQLAADGVSYGDPVELSEDNDWSYTWTDLPVNAAGSVKVPVEYTVKEAEVTGYTPTYGEVSGDEETGYVIEVTNAPSIEKLSIQKVVSGTTGTTEYEFRITLKSGDTDYSGDLEVTYSDGSSGVLTFTDGSCTITLKGGETITLSLVYGMSFEVVELDSDADSTLIYVDNEMTEKPADEDDVYAASGTVTKDTSVRFVNSYHGFFPIDEEIVPDYTDRTTWLKNEAVNEYNAIEIEMSTLLPVITGDELLNGEFSMVFHEVLDHELLLDEVDSDFMVYIGERQIDHKYYTVTIAPSEETAGISLFRTKNSIGDGCTFHVEIDLTALYRDGVITEDDLQGDTELIIFFFADLEGTGLNGTYKSTVWYEIYDGDDLLYTSNVDEVYVYTYEIEIKKVDEETGEPLEGAVFGIYYDENGSDPVSRNGEAYTTVSGEDGMAVFYGLADGTYYVKELAAPAGYILSEKVLAVELNEALNESGYAFEAEFGNVQDTAYLSGSGDDQNPSGTAQSTDAVNTGDEGRLTLWLTLLICSAVVLAAAGFGVKKMRVKA